MNIKIRTRYIILAIFLAICGAIILGWCWGRKNANSVSKPLISTLNSEITTYRGRIGIYSALISQTRQELVTERRARREMELKNSDLKTLNIRLKGDISRLQIQIDSLIKVPHTGKIVVIHDTITEYNTNAIMLPFDFGKQDKWLDLTGTFDEEGEMSLGVKMKAELNVITGVEKKTKKPTIVVYTDNPYIDVLNIKSYKTDFREKKYGIGLFTGYGISIKHPTDPSIIVGVGLSYNFIRF